MTSTDHLGVSEAQPPLAAGQRNGAIFRRRVRLRLTDLLLPIGVALWAFGVSATNPASLGSYGLPPVLPTAFWAGVALIVISAAIELGRGHPSGWRMALHAVILAVMLYGTAPLVYSQGRYEWLYKTIGVVQYVNANGQLNSQIDIYQNWPGFFALAAWFGKVAGVASPLAYAKWAQLAFELAALPLLYLAFDALSLTTRQRWLALLLYTGTNWIGQDYFSPQALGTVLSLGIMAMALRWFYVGNSPARVRPLWAWRARRADKAAPGPATPRARFPALLGFALLLIYFVLSFEHELSPYILAVQLGVLAVVGLLRPRWLPLLLAAIAIGYLIPHFAFVNSRYGLLNSIGQFFSNASPPALSAGGSLSAAQRTIGHSQEALSLGMWLLALAGAWLRRRSGRHVLTLLLLAFSPFLMLIILAYGQEGVLRVYLFSLPWTAALAAMALAPSPAAEGEPTAEGTETAEGTRKPAQALATSLWVPRNESRDAYDTMVFRRLASRGPGQAATRAAPGADAPRGQAGRHQAGPSGRPPWDDVPLPAEQSPGGNPDAAAVYAAFFPESRVDPPVTAGDDPARPGRHGAHRGRPARGTSPAANRGRTARPWVTVRVLLALGVGVALFFVAFFGDDGYNNMPQTEVTTVTSFLETAAPGPVYAAIDDAPLADTARYNQFPVTDIFGGDGITGGAPATATIANSVASFARNATRGRTPAYVLVTPGMVAYCEAYGAATPRDFTMLLTALAHSRAWKLVANHAGTVIYELPLAQTRR